MSILVPDQGRWKILSQVYSWYSEDKILSIMPIVGEKTIFQGTR